MEDTVHIVTLEQKPCVAHYLEQYNKYIIGTYELFSSIEDARLKLHSHLDDHELKKALERINYRAGKLILLRGNDVSVPSIEYEFDCELGGGVFDAKITYNKLDSTYSIFAAHSNGSIGVYSLSLHCGNKICLREHIKVTGSTMLTSIDIFPEPGRATHVNDAFGISTSSSANSHPTRILPTAGSPVPSRLVVGDAGGCVSVITQSGDLLRETVLKGDSVWQVKSLRLSSGREILFVGADNSSWYIYGIDEKKKKLHLLYKNSFKDFSAGVTCISILEIVHSVEYDLIELLLGSYDESIQTYHVKINHDGISKPDVCHKNTIFVQDGGIWRAKPIHGSNTKQLCIATMYAGSYILSLDNPSNEKALSKLIDIESLKLPNKPLHYDIAVSSCGRTYCIADFNNSLCLFKTIE